MTKFHLEQIECPNCENIEEFKVYDVIEVEQTEESCKLVEQVKNQQLFCYTCSECKKQLQIEYTMLYQDKQHHFMIYYVPETEEKIRQIEELKMPEDTTENLRLVTTKQELLEKIFLLENELDDCIIELCKVMVLGELKAQEREAIQEIFVEKIEQQRIFFILITKDEELFEANLLLECYYLLKHTYLVKKPQSFIQVNTKTIFSYLEFGVE